MFTQKLETMFTDLEVSKDLTTSYRKTANYSSDISLAFCIISSNWPMTNVNTGNEAIIVPGDMTTILDGFRDYYATIQPKRKLVWIHALSTCVIKASFEKVFFL
jgi:hypothetical protein